MRDFEAVVLGAGPAGCAAATLLARRSHRVALVRPSAPPAASLAESVPPSSRRILEELGFLHGVEGAGFHPNLGNSVWWASESPHVESFPTQRVGFHVDRQSLETVLVTEAERAGVTVLDDTRGRECTRGPEGWTVRCEDRSGSTIRLRAPWVVDATGRHGLLARENRIPDRSTTTLALVRRWRSATGWPGVAPGHTLVDSYEEGWAWSVPLADDLRCFTVMIDQRRADLEGPDLNAVLDRELSRTGHLGPARDGAEPVGDAWACPAALYTAASFGREGLLLAGDAGSFIDPLSSFGVKKALSSGWLAGVAAHTALADPAMTGTAVEFFDARERQVYRSYRRASEPFFRAGAEAYGTPYWTERAEAARAAGQGAAPAISDPDTAPGTAPDTTTDPDRLAGEVPENQVRKAFESLRARPDLRARPGGTLRVFERPGIEGHRIVLQDHVASDAVPEGMRWVRGVDLLTLLRIVPAHAQVPDAWSAYNDAAAPVSLPDWLTALSTAFAAGFLDHDDG